MSTNTSISTACRNLRREKLKQAFAAASSAEEMLKVVKKMERRGIEEKDLAFEYQELAKKFHNEHKCPEKMLYFGKKALKILLDKSKNCEYNCDGSAFFIASTLSVLGAACYYLKRYDESLSYLNWSEKNLFKLEESNFCNAHLLFHLLVDTERLLSGLKRDMGRLEECVVHLRKIVEVKEKNLEEGSLELGEAYKDIYVIYMAIMNSREALPFCVKALEIYGKHLGCESVKVAEIRVHLLGFYAELKEYDKALEQSRLAQSVFKKMGMNYELLGIQVRDSLVLIALGRYEEAIEALSFVLSHEDLGTCVRFNAHIYLAKANCKLGKFIDAKKYMKIGQKIIEELVVNSLDQEGGLKGPTFFAFAFWDMSRLYEMMHDFENAMSFTRRLLTIPELPQKLLVDGSRQLASLISQSGKVVQGIPYLEDAVKKLEQKFGPEHSAIGYAYADLGSVYMISKRAELAAKHLANAKSIMDVSLGPDHLDSLKTSEALSVAYAILKRFPLAIEVQEKVVEGLKGLGPSVEDRLEEAVEVLNQIMKGGADYESFMANNLQCDVSEDEMVLKLKEVKLKEEANSDD